MKLRSEGQTATRALRLSAHQTARSANGLRGGFRAVVIDHQLQRRPIGQDRLREELAQHVARQPTRRAVHGLRGLLSFGSCVG